MLKIKRVIILMFISIFITTQAGPTVIYAQTSQKRMEKIRRDIQIMEQILKKIIFHGAPEVFLTDNSIQGIYLDQYGILFDINVTSPFFHDDETALKFYKYISRKGKNDEQVLELEMNKQLKEKDENENKIIEDKIAKLKKQSEQFILDYATSLRFLDANDVININIHINPENAMLYTERSKFPTQIQTKAKFLDLKNYRLGKINKETMKKRIVHRDIIKQSDKHDLEIMATVFNEVIQERQNQPFLHFNSGTRATYLDGFGALFFLPVTNFNNTQMLTKLLNHNNNIVSIALNGEKVDTREKADKKIIALQNEMLEILGQYGHTLKQVKNEEQVLLAVELKNQFNIGNNKPSKFFIRVRKKDLDKFGRDEIKLDQIRKQAKIWQQ